MVPTLGGTFCLVEKLWVPPLPPGSHMCVRWVGTDVRECLCAQGSEAKVFCPLAEAKGQHGAGLGQTEPVSSSEHARAWLGECGPLYCVLVA